MAAVGISEVTVAVGFVVGGVAGCAVGMLVEWGNYADENFPQMLHALDGLNTAHDVWTQATDDFGDS